MSFRFPNPLLQVLNCCGQPWARSEAILNEDGAHGLQLVISCVLHVLGACSEVFARLDQIGHEIRRGLNSGDMRGHRLIRKDTMIHK